MAEVFDDYNKLVPLRKGLETSDAQLLRSLLNANDIEVFLNSENMSGLHCVVQTDVMIRVIDKVRADSVLKKVATLPRCALPRHFDEDGEERACTQCGSTQVHPFVGEVQTFIPGIRLAARKGDSWFHCLQCDTHYQDKHSRFAGMPIALMWSASLGGFVFALYWFFDWLRWL
ncbi:MAG: hypothetical protein JKY60_07735 [Kordiimonadaceae bacterium]|nr:hypothetical protein [Kordiimonadaceae bacterium]